MLGVSRRVGPAAGGRARAAGIGMCREMGCYYNYYDVSQPHEFKQPAPCTSTAVAAFARSGWQSRSKSIHQPMAT